MQLPASETASTAFEKEDEPAEVEGGRGTNANSDAIFGCANSPCGSIFALLARVRLPPTTSSETI